MYCKIIFFTLIFGKVFAEDSWSLFQNQFSDQHREVIFISNVTVKEEFSFNYNVSNWKSLNLGLNSIIGGITNNSELILISSTISMKNLIDIETNHRLIDWKISDITKFEFIRYWGKSGLTEIALIVHSQNQGFTCYNLLKENLTISEIWFWDIKENITNFELFRRRGKDFLIYVNEENSAIIHEFKVAKKPHLFYQSINLFHPTSSFCFSSFEFESYLSFAHPTINSLTVYHLSDGLFIPIINKTSILIDQIICFENLFKSFVAVNGQQAGIYKLTSKPAVLEHQEIINSNLDGIQFWIPMKVNTYRDETVLLLQRKLDHDTHKSFDVDVITYNGQKFEEHEDVSCNIFGQHFNGLKCFTEFNSVTGIYGSAYFGFEEQWALLVPNYSGAASTLYSFNLEIKKMENPAKKELEHYQKLRNRIQAEIDDYNGKAKNSLKAESQFQEVDEDKILKSSSSIMTDIETFHEDFLKPLLQSTEKSFIFNGPVEILNSLTVESVIDKEFNTDNYVQKDDLKSILKLKTFNNLHINSLNIPDHLEKLFVHKKSNNSIEINGKINFKSSVDVQNIQIEETLLNDKNFTELLLLNRVPKNITFDNLLAENIQRTNPEVFNTDSIFIPGNLTVTKINGQNFNDFLKKLCLVNVKCHIPRVKVSGKIRANNIKLNQLNNLKFPEEYVQQHSNNNDKIIIQGRKQFNDLIEAKNIIGKNKKFVSLSENQHIDGNFTFNILQAQSDFKVNGDVRIESSKPFLQNIGLDKSNIINSSVIIKDLEVLGNIIVTNNFNNSNINTYLNNFVLKSEDAKITGKKYFPQGITVYGNLHTESEMINNISLNKLITKNTPQDLNIKFLKENVAVERLYLQGLINGQNITELNRSLFEIKSNFSALNSTLIFEDEIVILEDLNANNIIIHGDLNITENRQIKKVFVEKDLIGDIPQFKLLKENSLNYADDQLISAPYYVKKLKVDNIQVNLINNIEKENSFSYKTLEKNITDILTYRNASVGALNCEGFLQAKFINQFNIAQFLENHIWMKLSQNHTNLTIDGDVYFKALNIEKLANKNFNSFVNSLVFKNQTDISIEDSLIFINESTVKNLITTTILNNVLLKNILRTDGEQEILGPLTIIGKVNIDDDSNEILAINNVPLSYMMDHFLFGEEFLKVEGDILFQHIQYIRDLTVSGLINGKEFKKIQEKFVHTHEGINLNYANFTFNNIVKVEQNLETTNGINDQIFLPKLMTKLVGITHDAADVNFNFPIKFTSLINCTESLNVVEDLTTNRLINKNLTKEIENLILMEKRPALSGDFKFEKIIITENLHTNYLNDIDMNSLILLNNTEKLNYMRINEATIVNDFTISGKINGIKLQEEENSTLMKNLEQSILSEIDFSNSVLIEGNLNISNTINNKKLSELFYTENPLENESQEEKPIILRTNVTLWAEDIQHNENLIEINNFELEGALKSLTSNITLNEINIINFFKNMMDKQEYFHGISKKNLHNYKKHCEELNNLIRISNNQLYKFNYFEEFQTLNFNENVQFIKYIKYQEQDYLLVNVVGSCSSELLRLQANGFVHINKIDTGVILQMEIVNDIDKNKLFLVSRGMEADNECNVPFSTALWEFDNEKLKLIETIPHQELLQYSKKNRTFYAYNAEIVTEFRIKPFSALVIEKIRQWTISEKNPVFIPHGFKTDLSMSTGTTIISLDTRAKIPEKEINFALSEIVIGKVTKRPNSIIPGKLGGNITVLNVGMPERQKTLLAIAKHKNSLMEHRMDVVELYSDPINGELFDQILSYRPSALTSVEFHNGETLIVFLEDNKLLQIFEFKGFEGFKHRATIHIHAEKIILLNSDSTLMGLVNNDKIIIIKAVMVGSREVQELRCAK